MFELFNRTNSLYKESAVRLVIFKCLVFHQKARGQYLLHWLWSDKLLAEKITQQELDIEMSSLLRRGLIIKDQDEEGYFFQITEDGFKYYNTGVLMSQLMQSTQNTIFVNIQFFTISIAVFALVSKFLSLCILVLIISAFVLVTILTYMDYKKKRKELKRLADNILEDYKKTSDNKNKNTDH